MIPLSHAQNRLWLADRLGGRDQSHHLPLTLRLVGELDTRALRQALTDVVARHEMLRTVFPAKGGIPYQLILGDAMVRLPVIDVDEAGLAAELADAVAEPFDLQRAIPLRVRLFRLGPHRHVLLVVLHRIAADRQSLRPFVTGLCEAYEARCAGMPPAWKPLSVQYADFALWQRDVLGDVRDPDSVLSRQLDRWCMALAGLPPRLRLPGESPGRVRPGGPAESVAFRIGPALHRELHALTRKCRATLFMALHAALAATLSSLGAGHDIPVASPVAGRSDEVLEGLIGCFGNVLIVRTDTADNPSFRELLARVRERVLFAYGHEEVPFDLLAEEIAPAAAAAGEPLVQVMLALNCAGPPRPVLPGLTVTDERIAAPTALVDLELAFTEHRLANGDPGGISGSLVHAAELFDRATAESLIERLLAVLREAVAEPDPVPGTLELLGPRHGRGALPKSRTGHATSRSRRAGRLRSGEETAAGECPLRDAAGAYRATVPRSAATPLEASLCQILASVLERNDVAPEDDFFELGGDSTLAVRVVSRIRATLGADLGVCTVFDAPTAAQLADALAESESETPEDDLPRA
ncbi:hypothetical protein HUT18_00715 [Streptomyces sp. NA04227]|uniref:condensation domain-containing protein n=1 Tax=Streptomyces sp. NA04227 TaxID=2742136 RepID=UPI0015903516|nr:condensation domain-containing protein [Streptomyces sp. NA04227]QKW05098.1 hypothetical protein HUT18_00715 [Streptomyces sp. NA04227]